MIEIDIDIINDIIKKAGREDKSELKALLLALELNELQQLIALMYVGRDDFTKEEWRTAMVQANIIPAQARVDFIISRPDLAEHLEEGLFLVRNSDIAL